MKIISRRRVEIVKHAEMFFANDQSGLSGYGFPCDAAGVVLPLENDCAKANLAKCLAGEGGILPGVLKTWDTRCTHPAVGQCERCGAEVYLGGFTNECECGADYNMSGQMLASREVWGEETSEHLSDILSIP
jgi:hypothetical protein